MRVKLLFSSCYTWTILMLLPSEWRRCTGDPGVLLKSGLISCPWMLRALAIQKEVYLWKSTWQADIINFKGLWYYITLVWCHVWAWPDGMPLGYFNLVFLFSLPHRWIIQHRHLWEGLLGWDSSRLIWQMGWVWGVIIARLVSSPFYCSCTGIPPNPTSPQLSNTTQASACMQPHN